MILIANLKKVYGSSFTLDIDEINIKPNSTTVLIGPSGCGKSTLLRLIMYLASPESGSITINGKKIDENSCRELRRQMGYVIQEGGLFPHLTAKENVLLVPKRLGWEKSRMETRLGELCELVNLERDLLERFPLHLSGGQRQRVSLMRALVLDPPILLMDEPLGALDPMIRIKLQTDLKEIFKRLAKTVVFVTHDMSEATFFGDEIVLMKQGRILQKGSVQNLLKNPTDPYVTEFINAQRPPEDLLK